MFKKKIWANFQRIIELFIQKIVILLSKIWVWDPGSEIRKKRTPDPGSRGQEGTRFRIPDPQHCFFLRFSLRQTFEEKKGISLNYIFFMFYNFLRFLIVMTTQ